MQIRSIDDTSNFDEFPDVDLQIPTGTSKRVLLYIQNALLDWCTGVQMRNIIIHLTNFAGGIGGGNNNNNNGYNNGCGAGYKDWVFINYTFKRFEGLTQRGHIPSAILSHSPSTSSSA